MNREEIRNRLVTYFKKQSISPLRQKIQMGDLNFFEDTIKGLDRPSQLQFYSIIREIIQEFINNGFFYPGLPSDFNSHLPWLTITEYGKEVFTKEEWLPYDPEGYMKALKSKVADLDDITSTYIGESVASFNRRQLMSATLTLGVASENLMLLLIESFLNWIKDSKRKANFEHKIRDRFIYTQYKEFKKEFSNEVNKLPKELQPDWETYPDGVFNFIRLNRNSAGHPTGKKLDAKVVYANLQIFSEYASYIFALIKYFS
jgi:hypothetical protein